MRFLVLLVAVLFMPFWLTGQDNYRIEIELEGYDNDTLLMAYYMGDRQLILDTAFRENGPFVFEGEGSLDPGMYLVVRHTDMSFFQMLIDEDNQNFSLVAENEDVVNTIEFDNSRQNESFFQYLNFLQVQRKKAEGLREEKSEVSERKAKKIDEALDQIDQEVKVYQENLIEEYKNSLLGKFVNANIEIQLPEFEGDKEEVRAKTIRYYRQHFLDRTDLSDAALHRTPVLNAKVVQYLDQVVSKNPDSISAAVDFILGEMEESESVFRFYLPFLLNKYARSKIIGMDGVYVHIVENYYKKGKSPWTSEEQIQKLIENSDRIKPTLIGKIAPDLLLEDRAGNSYSLHSLDHDYTILYFWRPDCGHCKRYTPKIVKFIEEFKEKGVEVVTVCTKFTDEVDGCWDYLDKTEGTDQFVNLVDPYHRSRFSVKYNVRSTPLIFVLNAEKKIISKRLSADQLPEIMPILMEQEDVGDLQLVDEQPGN